MKITIFFFCVSMMITVFLQSMDLSFKTKKTTSATQKCYQAIENNDCKLVKKAIAQGADVNYIPEINTNYKRNFLQIALDKKNVAVIETLLKAKKINVNEHSKYTNPPLHYAVLTGDPNILKLMLNHKEININIRNNDGRSCLFVALDSHSVYSRKMIEELLANEIDIHIADEVGNTILHYACEKRSADGINLILTHDNPPLNIQNSKGDTPLHILCQINDLNSMKLILSKRFFINERLCNLEKKSVLDIAFDNKYDNITSAWLDRFKTLIDVYRGDKRLFHYAIRTNNLEILKTILPSEYVNIENQSGYTPLMIAAATGYTEMVELFLKQNNCNPLYSNKYNAMALHYASENGHLACVEKLCTHGNINQKDCFLNTPLHLACTGKHISIIDYLIEQKATPLVKDKNGVPPFLIVYQNGIHDKINKKTLECMINARDKYHNTLLHILTAVKNISYSNYDDCLEFLLSHGLNMYTQNRKQLTALDMINNAYQPWNISLKIKHSFWRVASDNRSYGLLKEVLKNLPKDLCCIILIMYYMLSTEIIFAKMCKVKPDLLNLGYQSARFLMLSRLRDLFYFPLLFRPAILSYE